MDLLTEFDIKTVCRICLDCPEHQVSLWEYEKYDGGGLKQLAEVLMECTSVKVEEDGVLSEIICTDCLPILTSMYTFRNRCIATNAYLNKLVSNVDKDVDTNSNLTQNPEAIEVKVNIEDYETISSYFKEKDEVELTDTANEITLIDECDVDEDEKHESTEELNGKRETKEPKRVYQCYRCHKTFKNERWLQRHCFCCVSKTIVNTDSNDLEEVLRFPCDVCHDAFDTQNELVEHFHNHVRIATYFNFNRDDDLFCCYACDVKELIDEVDLHTHLSVHSKFTCNTCQKTYKEYTNLKLHLKTHGVWPHICQICLISFQTEEEADIHCKNHHQNESKSIYECALCDQQYKNCSRLKEHIKIHFEDAYYCTECGMRFKELADMESHKIKEHPPSSLCSICGLRFGNKMCLKRHFIRYHTVPKRVACNICHKTYLDRHALTQHMKKHTIGKRFQCSFSDCNYASFEKASVRIHERIHTNDRPYKCTFSECNFAFKTSSHLCQHMRLHTGEKRHTCSICDMKFASSSGLKSHELTHTDIRPHSCDICGKSFRKRYYVGVHKQKMH